MNKIRSLDDNLNLEDGDPNLSSNQDLDLDATSDVDESSNSLDGLVDQDKNVIDFKRNIFDLEIGGLYRHIGIYGFRRNTLFQSSMLEQSPRELEKKLEQMRALDNGLPIRAAITGFESFAVDTQSDLNKVAEIMGVKEIGLD